MQTGPRHFGAFGENTNLGAPDQVGGEDGIAVGDIDGGNDGRAVGDFDGRAVGASVGAGVGLMPLSSARIVPANATWSRVGAAVGVADGAGVCFL